MISDTLRGMHAYVRAFELAGKLRLWGYFLVPAILSLLLLGALAALLWAFSDDLGSWLTRWYPWEWGRTAVETIAGGLAMVLLFLLLYKHLVMILCGPFLSPMTEKIEAHLSGKEVYHPSGIRDNARLVFRGLRIALRLLVREILLTIPLLLIGLIPVLSLLSTVLLFLIQSYYAGFGNADFTLERHFRVRASIDFVHRNRGLALGNGIVFILLLGLGIGFIIAPPLSAAAAAINTTERLASDNS